MAKSSNNIITHGMSGMIGDLLVFRQTKDGQTIVAAKPKASSKPATAEQQQIRDNFQQAIIYGRSVNADPTAKIAYAAGAKEGQRPFNAAVADFLHAPHISGVNLSGYTGAIGDKIKVQVTDDFMVASVWVKIENGDSSLVEEGMAVYTPGTIEWVYTATVANASLAGDKITITARDTPGHDTIDKHTL